MRKGLRTLLSSGLLLIVAAGAMATASTAVSYAGTCAALTGFPGLLQRVGLVAAGPCASKAGGSTCTSAECTTSDRKPGKCRNIAASGPANCACVATAVSSGLR
jgi:hypothetical protein